jgi:phosphoglycolate phosphatase-like HAD superfamily hydrolase/tRNA(Arg) A34 adenosine deaminase TadA
MVLDAVLFDIDGTLFDSNSLQVKAWHRVLEARGFRVGRDRIEVEIGKGGNKLVASILGRRIDDCDGDSLCKSQTEEFARLARTEGARPFPGTMQLLTALRQRGVKVALVTSHNKQHLSMLEMASGVALGTTVDVIVTVEHARELKPTPDLVAAAVHELCLSPAQCAMVGSTRYDMRVAKLAGVIGLGTLTGFQSRQSLLRAGARVVYTDIAELLESLNEALHLASPTAIHLTTAALEGLMREALAEARRGLASGEAPIGCVLADGGGHIIARGHNQFNHRRDRTAHAEMVVFRDCAGRIPHDARDYILVSTLEPCVMCTGAAMEAAMDTIVYGLQAPADSGTGRVQPPETPESQMPRIVGGVLAREARALFENFASTATDPLQRAFTQQLLALTR